jgi:Lrp/AsnC family transcriptional regulator, leucine-responsive regulatory protein
MTVRFAHECRDVYRSSQLHSASGLHFESELPKMPPFSNLLRDDRNIELIRLLLADPRAPVSELARRIGMSAPAVKERLLRLEESGVIRGYRLELDPAALGLPVTVYVRVRPAAGQLPKVIALAQSIPQVVECHRITGEDCFIVKVHLDSIENLDQVLDRFLAFGQTTTSLVQSSPVPLRAPPLPQGTTAPPTRRRKRRV